jgi:hypothetical protein
MLFTGQKMPFQIKVPVNYQPNDYDQLLEFSTYFMVLLRAYHIVPNTTSPQAAAFFEQVKHLPIGSTVLISAGEIDCRGPIINVAEREKRTIRDVTEECVERYLKGVKMIKDWGYKPILYAPIPNQEVYADNVASFHAVPKWLSVQKWHLYKWEASWRFSQLLQESDFPIVSLQRWMNDNHIVSCPSYWCDVLHLSEKVWPQLVFEFSQIGIFIDMTRRGPIQ